MDWKAVGVILILSMAFSFALGYVFAGSKKEVFQKSADKVITVTKTVKGDTITKTEYKPVERLEVVKSHTQYFGTELSNKHVQMQYSHKVFKNLWIGGTLGIDKNTQISYGLTIGFSF